MKKDWKVLVGNNIDLLKSYEDNTFDSIVTDPPYGIEFLGKDWDKDTGAMETWEECLRVLKPGGYILAFSAARTYHNLATNIESAGFEIRDQIMWLYGSGFPKAQDMGKVIDKRNGKQSDNEWSGWKTALKPAHEPIVMARKPFKGSCIDNVLNHGVGALNIDGSRVEYADEAEKELRLSYNKYAGKIYGDEGVYDVKTSQGASSEKGRYPSNVIGEVTDYQKYFYCPKVGRAERHVGFEPPETNGKGHTQMYGEEQAVLRNTNNLSTGNNHPTVKPVELMKYLVKLVTPEGGIVLDPFNGSGSTGMACVELGYEYVGCELDPNYVEIATNRIAAWEAKFNDDHFDSLFDKGD